MLLCTGGGAYVVIDKRKKSDSNAQETSSEDGEMLSSLTFNIFFVFSYVIEMYFTKIHYAYFCYLFASNLFALYVV